MERDGAAVQTERLTKVYRNFWGLASVKALVELDMGVRHGEIFGLLGPNGSGKTTTIMLLLGLIRPTSGRAIVMDKPAGDQHARGLIGYLPEETYLYKFLSAEKTLDFFGKLFGIPRHERRRRIAELLDVVGLDAKARKRRVGTYSKGMARRIGLAQAMINDPDLLILDEPTSGLDPLGAIEMKDLLRRLRDQGKTILLSSHLLADVEDVCDRILMLYRGRKELEGSVRDLLDEEDTWQIQLRGAQAPLRDDLLEQARKAGAEVVGWGHRRQRLEELFKKRIGARLLAEEDAARR